MGIARREPEDFKTMAQNLFFLPPGLHHGDAALWCIGLML
jgi:hypothetical protein